MRNVQDFKGNMTTDLWATMGKQVNASGMERDGQACYLVVYPNGTEATREALRSAFDTLTDSATLSDEGDTAIGPIDMVAQLVLTNYIQLQTPDMQPEDVSADYDGLRAGAGWIYATILVAKGHGCTQAMVSISSNDGNLYMEAWDYELGALVTAVHHTYYGT